MQGRTNYNYGYNILTIKDLNYMFDIYMSGQSENERAYALHEYCGYKSLQVSYEFYEDLLQSGLIKNPLAIKKLQEANILDKLHKLMNFYNRNKAYFDKLKNAYKCTTLEIRSRLKKINIFHNIINSNLNNHQKAEGILNLFPDSETFRKSYTLFLKFGEKDSNLDIARDALNNFENLYNKFKELEQNGIIDDIKYYNRIKEYLRNYKYAAFIIRCYINDKDSYKTKVFFDQLGINTEIFEYCVATIEILDDDLYIKYLEKEKENQQIRFMSNVETIKNLATGIKTGFLSDGTPFDLLQFIKRVPFKGYNYMYPLIDFMKRNTPDECDIIINYMTQNKIYRCNVFDPLDINALYKTRTIINGREITNEDNDIILDYLRIGDIPLINVTYLFVRGKYLNGEIDIDLLKEQKKQKELRKSKEIKVIAGIQK